MKKNKNTTPQEKGTVKYVMSQQMYRELLKLRTEGEKKMNPQDYLIKLINAEFGVRGKVIEVIAN